MCFVFVSHDMKLVMQTSISSPNFVALLIFLNLSSILAEPIEFFKRDVMDVTFGGDFHMQVVDFEGDGPAQVLVGGDNGLHR